VSEDIYKDIESGVMSLEERLEDMGIDPKEYKTYGASSRYDFLPVIGMLMQFPGS